MKKSSYLIIGVIMLGVVMRAPFTSIPALLIDIATDLDVSISSLGFLTSLPVLMFALFSALVPGVAERFGLEKTVGTLLMIMTVGSFVRMTGLVGLYVGTAMIGIGIAFINVLLPSFVSQHFPKRISFYTTLYVSVMGLSVTFFSMLAPLIVRATSWQFFVGLLSGLLLLASLLWLPNCSYDSRTQQKKVKKVSQPLWRQVGAVAFLLFGGLQSIIYYTEIAWLSTMAQHAGLGHTEAGVIMGVFSLIGIPVALVIPNLVSILPSKGRRNVMLVLSAVSLPGLFGMLLNTSSFIVWLTISLLLGLSAGALFPYMMLSFSLKTRNPEQAARLSGMVQSGGYLLAAIGPGLLGYSYQGTGSWSFLVWILIGVTILMMGSIVMIEKEDIIGA